MPIYCTSVDQLIISDECPVHSLTYCSVCSSICCSVLLTCFLHTMQCTQSSHALPCNVDAALAMQGRDTAERIVRILRFPLPRRSMLHAHAPCVSSRHAGRRFTTVQRPDVPAEEGNLKLFAVCLSLSLDHGVQAGLYLCSDHSQCLIQSIHRNAPSPLISSPALPASSSISLR